MMQRGGGGGRVPGKERASGFMRRENLKTIIARIGARRGRCLLEALPMCGVLLFIATMRFLRLTELASRERSQIIWVKNNFAISRGDYHWRHEPCWYVVRGIGYWNGDRTQSTVWEIDKPQKSETGHSAQKPVECMKRPIGIMIHSSAQAQRSSQRK